MFCLVERLIDWLTDWFSGALHLKSSLGEEYFAYIGTSPAVKPVLTEDLLDWKFCLFYYTMNSPSMVDKLLYRCFGGQVIKNRRFWITVPWLKPCLGYPWKLRRCVRSLVKGCWVLQELRFPLPFLHWQLSQVWVLTQWIRSYGFNDSIPVGSNKEFFIDTMIFLVQQSACKNERHCFFLFIAWPLYNAQIWLNKGWH